MRPQDSPLRVGAVSFLNSVPLIDGLSGDPGVVLVRDLPARLSDLLYEDRIEVGLIPMVEYLRGIGGDIVPGICIGSNGPVRTVKIFSKIPLEHAQSIAVDRGSRSSVAMLRVLLAEMFDRSPDLHIVEPRPEDLFLHHETVLVIGDRAEQVPLHDDLYVYDLGQLWQDFTGLPFVYAAWVTSPKLSSADQVGRRTHLAQRLQQAKQEGLARRQELAALHAPATGHDVDHILSYWNDAIVYDLGEAELAGLNRFAELCAKYNLCSARSAVSVAELG